MKASPSVRTGHTLFGICLGLFMWGGLWLRDASLRPIFPLRRTVV